MSTRGGAKKIAEVGWIPYTDVCGKCGAGRVDQQIGLEASPDEYIATIVEVFREIRRVLRADGTAWINLGDSYAGSGRGVSPGGASSTIEGAQSTASMVKRARDQGEIGGTARDTAVTNLGRRASLGRNKQERAIEARAIGRAWVPAPAKFKAKDLMGMPARVVAALQAPYYLGSIKREIDRVWLAAMVDGEGCVYIGRHPVGHLSGRSMTPRRQEAYCVGIALSNTCLSIVERVADIVGRGNVRCVKAKGNKRVHYTWCVTGNVAKRILLEIYPYLVGKQREARVAIGCPPSGETGTLHWQNLKHLHKGEPTEFDAPQPDCGALWEPGWYVRSEIIWQKPNPMPESVLDRPTKAHEMLYLLSKSEVYHYDAEAIMVPSSPNSHARAARGRSDTHKNADGGPGHQTIASGASVAGRKIPGTGRKVPAGWDTGAGDHRGKSGRYARPRSNPSFNASVTELVTMRNARTVWTIATEAYPGAHFATFPTALVAPCVLAGCPPGGTVLDPFGGSGTTGLVAARLGRNAVLIELNPAYAAMARDRLKADLLEVSSDLAEPTADDLPLFSVS